MRLVSRPICWAPVALLLGNVRNRSRLTGSAPLRNQVGVDEREVGDTHPRCCRGCTGACPRPALRGPRCRLRSHFRPGLRCPGCRRVRCIVARIGFEDFGRSQEPENGHVSCRQPATCERRSCIGQQSCCADCSGSDRKSPAHEGTATCQVFGRFNLCHTCSFAAVAWRTVRHLSNAVIGDASSGGVSASSKRAASRMPRGGATKTRKTHHCALSGVWPNYRPRNVFRGGKGIDVRPWRPGCRGLPLAPHR